MLPSSNVCHLERRQTCGKPSEVDGGPLCSEVASLEGLIRSLSLASHFVGPPTHSVPDHTMESHVAQSEEEVGGNKRLDDENNAVTTERQLASLATRYRDRLALLQRQRAESESVRRRREQRDWARSKQEEVALDSTPAGGQTGDEEESTSHSSLVGGNEGSSSPVASRHHPNTSSAHRVLACLSDPVQEGTASALARSMQRVKAQAASMSAACGGNHNHERVVSELVERLQQRRAEFERTGSDTLQRLTELLSASHEHSPRAAPWLSDRSSVASPSPGAAVERGGGAGLEDVGGSHMDDTRDHRHIHCDDRRSVNDRDGVNGTPLHVTVTVPHLLTHGLLFTTLDAVSTILTSLSVEDVMRMTARQLALQLLDAARCGVVKPASSTLGAYESNYALFSQISLSAARSSLLEWDCPDVLSDMYDRGSVAVVLSGPHLQYPTDTAGAGGCDDESNRTASARLQGEDADATGRTSAPLQGLPLRGEIPLSASGLFRRWAAVSWEASRFQEEGCDGSRHGDDPALVVSPPLDGGDDHLPRHRFASLQPIQLHAFVFMLRPATADALNFRQQFPVDILGNPSYM